MYIRSYKEEDAPILRDLFWNTVHTVNAVDYTRIQLDAWAPVEYDRNAWNQRFLDHTSFVVENDGHIVGFGDMDEYFYWRMVDYFSKNLLGKQEESVDIPRR